MTLRTALRHRAYRSALLSNFATGWSVFGLRMAVVPLFISDVLKRGPQMTGVALAVFAAGNVIVVMPSGYLSDKIGRKQVMMAGCLVAVLTYLPIHKAMQTAAGNNVVAVTSAKNPVTGAISLTPVSIDSVPWRTVLTVAISESCILRSAVASLPIPLSPPVSMRPVRSPLAIR